MATSVEFGGAANDPVVAALRSLLVVCRDAEEGYKHACERVSDRELSSELRRRWLERASFVLELRDALFRHGWTADEEGSTLGAIHRRWLDAKAAMARGDAHAILDEVARGERAAIAAYERALGQALPADVRPMIHAQHDAIRKEALRG